MGEVHVGWGGWGIRGGGRGGGSLDPARALEGVPDYLESLPILWSGLVGIYPGRPEAHPAAVGWDEELRAQIAGVCHGGYFARK